ncbi:MAG: zinc-finger domain-containing protein [Alphaproteobacteria bacterium]|nr:zinc-finger domain-containing protein [Alphaproteobacteria bacterium]
MPVATVSSAETIVVTAPQVSCDGGVGPLGHPRVFLTVPSGDGRACPYCGKTFVLGSAAAPSGRH